MLLFFNIIKAQSLDYKLLNQEHGLTTTFVHSMYIDSRGIKWVGTGKHGLLRFDGKKFKKIEESFGLHSYNISNIIEDSNGNLILSLFNYGIVVFDGEKVIKIIKADKDSPLRNYKIEFKNNTDESLTIFTSEAIYKCDIKNNYKTKKVIDFNSKEKNVSFLYFTTPNNITYIILDNEILKIENNNITILKNSINNSKISAVNQISDDEIYIANENSEILKILINQKNELNSKLLFKNFKTIDGKGFIPKQILVEDDSNMIITGRDDNGIILIENNQVNNSNTSKKFPSSNLDKIIKDRNGELFFPTIGKGILHIPSTKFYNYRDIKEASLPNTFNIVRKDGKIILADSKRGIYSFNEDKNGKLTLFKKFEPTKNDPKKFISIYKNLDNNIISLGNSLHFYDLDKNILIPIIIKKLSNNTSNLNSIIQLKNKEYVLSHIKGIIILDENFNVIKEFETYQNSPIYSVDSSIEFNDKIIFGGISGVYELFKEKNEYEIKKISNYHITGITKDFQGVLWFPSNDDLISYNGDTFSEHSSYSTANTKDIYTIVPLKNSKLLVGSNIGVEILKLNSENKIIDVRPYGYNSGFNGLETNGNKFIYDIEGNPYFNTSNGLYKYIDNDSKESKIQYVPNLNNVSIVDKNEDWIYNNSNIDKWHKIPNENYEFNADENFLKFSFTTNYPINEAKVLYAYKLVGNDKNWTTPSSSNEITYNNLSYKKYKLLVKTTNTNGTQIGEQFSYVFSIKPPLYLDWRFIIPLLIILSLGILYVYKSTKKYDDELSSNFFEASNNITEYSYYFLFIGIYIILMYVIDLYLISNNLSILIFKVSIGGSCICIYGLNKTNNFVKKNIKILFSIFCILYYLYSFSILFTREVNVVLVCQAILAISLLNLIFKSHRDYITFSFLNICFAFILYVYKPENIKEVYALFFSIVFLLLINYARRISILNTKENFVFAYNIINSSNAIILAINNEGIIKFVGNSVENITGYSTKEVINSKISEFTETQNLNFDNYEKEDNKKAIEISKFKCKNGKKKYIQWSTKKYSHNLTLCIGQDITNRIELEEQYKNIVQFANDIICETDVHGNIVFANKYAEEILEYTSDEILNINYSKIIHPDFISDFNESFKSQNLINTNQINAIEFQLYTKNKNIIWASQRARIKRDIDDNIIGYISILRDITQEKKLAIEEQNRYEYNKLLNFTLNQISSFNFISFKDKDELVKKVAEKVLPILNVNRLSLWYKFGDNLEKISLFDTLENKSFKGDIIDLKKTPNYLNYLQNNLYFTNLDNKNTAIEVNENYGTIYDLKSYIDIPFYSKGVLDGLISFESNKFEKIWTHDEINFCKNVVDVMLLALANIKRNEAEKLTIYKSEILTAISKTTHLLISSKNINDIFDYTFQHIGQAAKVDRAYFFRVDSENETMSQKFEWTENGITPVIDLEELQNIPKNVMPDLYGSLSNNIPFIYKIKDLKLSQTRTIFESQDIKSIVILPIFVQKEFYGFIGFDDCTTERDWSIDEVNILNTFAGNIQVTIERILNERATKESEEKFRLLANNIPAGVYLYDYTSKTNKLFLNDTIKNLSGFSYDEFKNGENLIANLYHPEDAKKAQSKISKALKNKTPYFNSSRIINSKGETLWIEEYGEGVYENDKIKYIQGVIIDITERKNAEEAIRAREIAEASSKSKMEFLANMSHEIRTPLNGVIGFTDLLNKTNLNNVQQQYVQVINQSSKSLLEVVNDILDFSKIEAGKLDISPIKIDLFELIDQITDMIKFNVHDKKLDFIINVDDKIPQYIWIDSIRIKQILVNLLSNAVKFTSQGYIEFGINLLNINKFSAELNFYVRDTGIGIKKENREKIFEVFTQEDNSTTRLYGGTGLGLPISNSLLKLMDSRIIVKDNEIANSGSEFSFKLKVNYENKINKIELPTHLKNILIIDSENQNSKNFKNKIENLGYNTKIIENQNSIQNYKDQTDLLIIDNDFITKKTFDEILTWKIPIINAISSTTNINSLPKFQLLSEKIKPLKTYAIKKYIFEAFDNKVIKKEQDPTNSQILQNDYIKILIVEDNKVNMLLTVTLVTKLFPNAEIFKAFNGEEGVQMHKLYKPDIILMDIQMPIKNGYDATKEIRQIDNESIIIALTAAIIKDEVEKCKNVNMNDYISKPIDRDELFNKLKYWLNLKKNTSHN